MASNMDTFINLLAAPLEPPTAGSFLGAEQAQQNADGVVFKTPSCPASAYRQDAAEPRKETTATAADTSRVLEPGEINESQPQLEDRLLVQANNNKSSAAMTCPSDTKSARRLRKKMPQFSIDHSEAGTMTYGRVPVDPQVMNLSNRPFLEIYRTTLRLASATMERLVDDNPRCLRVIELLDAIHKERNS
jgi:hypothetical protein